MRSQWDDAWGERLVVPGTAESCDDSGTDEDDDGDVDDNVRCLQSFASFIFVFP